MLKSSALKHSLSECCCPVIVLCLILVSMALAVTVRNAIPADQHADLIGTLSNELRYLFDHEGIIPGIQAKFAQMGVIDINAFAKLEDQQAEMRALVKEELGINPFDGGGNRGMIAKILSAWDSAVQRGVKRKAEEAERKVGDQPRRLPMPIHLSILRAFNRLHTELEEEEIPGPRWLETRLDQLETGELIPETLDQVGTWMEEEGSAALDIQLRTDGFIKAVKTTSMKGKLPDNPEHLRLKFVLMAHHWEFVRLKMPTLAVLADYDMSIWDTHVKFLLGRKVYHLEVKAEDDSTQYKPTWKQVLKYEFQLRKKACRAMNVDNLTLRAALHQARKDTETYAEHFTTPVSIAAGAAAARAEVQQVLSQFPKPLQVPVRERPEEGLTRPAFQTQQQGAGGKGADSAKGKKIKKQFCWAFNEKRGCPLGDNCRRIHKPKGRGKGSRGQGKQE